jgi:hypothetical protein
MLWLRVMMAKTLFMGQGRHLYTCPYSAYLYMRVEEQTRFAVFVQTVCYTTYTLYSVGLHLTTRKINFSVSTQRVSVRCAG